ncbi:hypothetical protein ACIGO8_12710 [Streptomyces sp. NPDC053493]|uniref:DUF6197 family protein n=1 Tax=Streptomyces sp. NPDC053493 TaxID=3365705 RepID=UPI0037D2990F
MPSPAVAAPTTLSDAPAPLAAYAAPAASEAPDAYAASDAPAALDALDREAAALRDTEAWREIVARWTETPPAPEETDGQDWRRLLSVPVDRLVADALAALDTRPAPPPGPAGRPLPGRLGAILPDRLHTWRRIGAPDVRPSVHLAHARRVLTEWGWQNTPYKLRDARGARCVCGAMLAAHRLGHGSAATMNEAGAWMLEELRSRGWTELIGPWNRAPGRTAADALALVDATIRRAARAGR